MVTTTNHTGNQVDENHTRTQAENRRSMTAPGVSAWSPTRMADARRTATTCCCGTTSYAYDPAGYMETVTAPDGGITRYAYDANRPTEARLPNGVRTRTVYDQRDRVTHIEQDFPANPAVPVSYIHTDYDAAGQKVGGTEFLGGTVESLCWRYDAAGRLTAEARYDLVDAPLYDTRFTYDATGNRLSQTINGLRTSYAYDALDRLLSAQNGAGTVGYAYDGRGNLSSVSGAIGVTSYAWDSQNRMVGVTQPNGTQIAYGYDADGRRVSATTGTTTRGFVWDEISMYGDVVAELDGSGGLLTGYVLANGAIVSQTQGGASSYYLADSLGSTRALTDGAGSVTDTYSYTAYGETHASTGSTSNSYLYAGQQQDAATGLYSMRARMYDPGVGRFVSRDTWALDMGNPVEWNRYGYAAIARALDADEVILYREQDFAHEVKRLTGGRGVQVVYDAVGADTFEKSLTSLAGRGTLALFGASSGMVPLFDLQRLNGLGSLFVTRPTLHDSREEILMRAGDLFDWLADGSLRLTIDREFALRDAAAAHSALEGRESMGKFLLVL